jgi:hypothetical protein
MDSVQFHPSMPNHSTHEIRVVMSVKSFFFSDLKYFHIHRLAEEFSFRIRHVEERMYSTLEPSNRRSRDIAASPRICPVEKHIAA